MKIDVSSISKTDGAFLDVRISGIVEGLNEVYDEYLFDKPVSFKGSVENRGGILILHGDLNTSYHVKCSKCLKDIDSIMNISIMENFIEEKNKADDESYTYKGNFIELDRVFKDNIILNLPVRQVCNEDCKGLCPICGANLNVTSCECREDEVDSRMEVLRNFFNN